jgi:hypothetical protein
MDLAGDPLAAVVEVFNRWEEVERIAELRSHSDGSEVGKAILEAEIERIKRGRKSPSELHQEAEKELEELNWRMEYINRPEEEQRLQNIALEKQRNNNENMAVLKTEINNIIYEETKGKYSGVIDVLQHGGKVDILSEGEKDATLTIDLRFDGKPAQRLTETLRNWFRQDRNVSVESEAFWRQYSNSAIAPGRTE